MPNRPLSMPSQRPEAPASRLAWAAPRSSLRWRSIDLPDGLVPVFEGIRHRSLPWLLDSARAGGPRGRHSFAGADPYMVLRAWGRRVELDVRRPVLPALEPGLHAVEGDPLDLVRACMPGPPAIREPQVASLPFLGGAVGYFGYELAEQVDASRLHGRDDLGFPDVLLLFVDRFIAYCHEDGRGLALALGFSPDFDAHEDEAESRPAEAGERAEEALADWLGSLGARRPARRAPDARVGPIRFDLANEDLQSSLPRPAYVSGVRDLIGEIGRGNVYEANLSQRLVVPHSGEPWPLYRALRRRNPAPFSAYLELDEGAVLCSSPERFLSLDAQGRAESRPIKGTRRRDADPDADCSLAEELGRSEKDRAENLMIVDLVRNDLGRVCRLGSVEVPQLMGVEDYASVWHLVSAVTGRLRPECDGLDLLRACFPPGSMTGAPKLAAIARIDAIEPVRRGIYSGALGYLDLRGGLDLAVVIRTLILKKGHAYIHVGGAVVADSDPEAEYRESLDKAEALLRALADASANRGAEEGTGHSG